MTREWTKHTIPTASGLGHVAPLNTAPQCDHPNEIPDDEPPCQWCAAGDTDVRGLFCSEACAGFSDAYDDGFEDGSTATAYDVSSRLRDIASLATTARIREDIVALAREIAPDFTGDE